MLKGSAAYQSAIVGSPRKILLRAIIDIIDPDITYGTVTADSKAPYSNDAQLHDKLWNLYPVATLERNRWILDGSMDILPDSYVMPDKQVGYVGNVLSGDDGTFAVPAWVQLSFANVSILQAFSIYFSKVSLDGVPADFTVEVLTGSQVFYTKTVTGNLETMVQFKEFTVYNPDAIKITVTRWSLPGRRMRIPEIIPGLFEEWTGAQIQAFNVNQQANFSCLSLPYGTCTIAMDNVDRRFEPRNKNGLFQSIDERQAIEVSIGVELQDGTEEFQPVGVYYQFSDGWKTGDNGMTMTWNLVDIVGLLANREFIPPDQLPTTLDGWFAAFVAQLGTNFAKRYHVDPNYANLPVTAAREDVTGKLVGELMRYACMATGTWPRADDKTGYLTAEPLWNEGNKLTLDNMVGYPGMQANRSLAALIFTLADGSETQYVIAGNSASAEDTVSIKNPFIHTKEQALTASRLILSTYGGNYIDITGRGDPVSEIGDVDTVWLNESVAAAGRRIMQSFNFNSGVLQGCQSKLLQADGSYLYEEFALITESGQWQAPPGVLRLRLVLSQAGQGAGHGKDGFVGGSGVLPGQGVTAGYGEPGPDGQGGLVWFGVVDINPEQIFTVNIGKGGAPATVKGAAGEVGTHTTFGVYTSADGSYYPLGYTDIANGLTYARTGVPLPVDGSGDGAKGGDGGEPGSGYWKQTFWPDGRPSGFDFIITKQPGHGKPGKRGADGFALISWDKGEKT